MPLRIPIGIDDFRTLREQGLEYVDKSHLIRELIDRPGIQVALLPRPRRFGKSLGLSMLRCFFEKQDEDLSHLFEDLAIWRAGPAYREHFQRYPVIHLTFKGIKSDTWEGCWAALRRRISKLFLQHRRVLDRPDMSEWEARDYHGVLDGTAGREVFEQALLDLSTQLHRYHGEKVVILIDEYDEPIHAGYMHGYAREALSFFRAFLGEGLKGNPHLHRAVLTGILRIARESIFSGLNNLAVFSLLNPIFATCFGFTEPEVAALLDKADRGDKLPDAVKGMERQQTLGGTGPCVWAGGGERDRGETNASADAGQSGASCEARLPPAPQVIGRSQGARFARPMSIPSLSATCT